MDDEDYFRLTKWKWYAIRPRNVWYAVRNEKGRKVYMHRELCEGIEVDHVDGEGLNNQKKNLRRCTHRQNLQNTGLRSSNKSGFKGVSWCERDQRWVAFIRDNEGNRRNLGSFKQVQDAARAYAEASKKYHKEFART